LKRRRIDPRDATLIEIAYARTGSMLRAARVVAFIQAWGVTRRELGRTPTMDEYVDFWGEGRSTAYKHLGEFREVFDRCEWPDPVLDLLAAAQADRADLRAVTARA
jgi:hypothetical protein